VALGAPLLFSGFSWKAGLLLGAVVAPTDALAATSIAQKVGLPKQITYVLEGESLVNDATGLLALEFGIAMLIYDQRPTVASGALRLLFLTIAGIAVGLITGWIVDRFERRIDDGPIEIALSILVPYAAYFVAEEIRASGVLAVVACGLYLARRSSGFFSPGVRLQTSAVWDALAFILNGLVFILIGLQMHYVLAAIQGYSVRTLALYAGLFSVLVVALRMVWVFPSAHVAYAIRRKFGHQKVQTPTNRSILVIGWTGMRGGIALAAAISLPQLMTDGRPFAQRNLILFLAYSVILVTLVLQGLTLPWLVRALGLANAEEENPEEAMARRKMLEAALHYLEECKLEDEHLSALYEDLSGHYRHRLKAVTGQGKLTGAQEESHQRFSEIAREAVEVERRTALRLRNTGQINDETLRTLERELDLREASAES
jgi:CPA1 family monovalent cation:H+ antiporter